MNDVRSNYIATATSAANSPKSFRLGVLFVHGIGTQPARNTLVQWSDDLLKVIGRATDNQVVATVERAWPGDGSAENPAEAVVRLRADDHQETWLLAEGWWADTFPSPSYGELVSWSFRAVPWAVAIHIAQRYWQTATGTSRRRRFLARSMAVLQLLFALALAPVFIFLLALTLVLGILPIPQLRTVILSAQSVLAGTVGDSLAFVESPLRAALIRTRVLGSLENLIQRCDRTVIVAHSQGAAAVLDALGGIAKTGEDEAVAEPQVSTAGAVPDTLLTFGSGINQLVSLKVLSRGMPTKLGVNPVNFGVGSLVATFISFAWLFESLRRGDTTVSAMVHAAAVLIVSFAMGWLLYTVAMSWATKHLNPKQHTPGDKVDVQTWFVTIPLLLMLGGGLYYADRNNLPLGSVNLLGMALLMSVASLTLILSRDMRKVVTAPVREPVGLARWVDLYASADPVPNGPIRIEKPRVLTSIPIWNQGSTFTDHTSYWQNPDGFTLRVARVCAETAESPWLSHLPPESTSVDRRAAWRLDFLRLSRGITGLTWLFVLLLLWNRHGLTVPPVKLPSWVPFGGWTFTQWATVPLVIAAAAWLTSRLLFWSWALWVRAEQRATLVRAHPSDRPWAPLIAMGIIVSLVLSLAFAVARGSWSTAQPIVDDPRQLLDFAWVVLLWGVVLAFLARWLMPAPLAIDSGGDQTAGPGTQ